ncbi:MAG: hypothetical protein KBF37_03525 [Saprospiraceae bacterium]|nr:hypothetical protein [Saprospiraceae bacterium]MBP9209372.1 hypothetical protein [Saprospiraceae bacterium]
METSFPLPVVCDWRIFETPFTIDAMLRLIVFALAIYAVYVLFLKDRVIVISPKKRKRHDDNYTDFEEMK